MADFRFALRQFQKSPGFTEQEETGGKHFVVLISHELWQRDFGGEDSVLGRSIQATAKWSSASFSTSPRPTPTGTCRHD